MGKQQEEARAMSPAPTATIKLDSWWNHPERHGAMFDLAASEDVKLREGEVKVIPLGIRMKLPEGYFGLVVCMHREPSYGWKKLEEDARKRICDYAHAPRDDDGLVTCDGCRFHKPETGLNCIQNFGIDLVKRAKRLAGIKEQEGDA